MVRGKVVWGLMLTHSVYGGVFFHRWEKKEGTQLWRTLVHHYEMKQPFLPSHSLATFSV